MLLTKAKANGRSIKVVTEEWAKLTKEEKEEYTDKVVEGKRGRYIA